MLYQVVFLKTVGEIEQAKGKENRIILGPVLVMAKDSNTAILRATLDNRENLPETMEGVEVVVRDF